MSEVQSPPSKGPFTSEASAKYRIFVADDDAVDSSRSDRFSGGRAGSSNLRASYERARNDTDGQKNAARPSCLRHELASGQRCRDCSAHTKRASRNRGAGSVFIHDSPEVARITLRAGARGFLSKSDPHEEIVAAMHEVRKRKLHVTTLVASKLETETERIPELDASPDPTLTPQEVASVLARSEMKIQADLAQIVQPQNRR